MAQSKYDVTIVDAETLNVLLIGRSQCGKSALVEALKNPRYCRTNASVSITRQAKCHSMVMTTEDGQGKKHYQLNVIDSPGLKEVSWDKEHQRTDEELLALVQLCIEQNITTINCVCFVSIAGETHQLDIDIFEKLMDFLGPELSANTIMLLTHCEQYTDAKLKEFQDNIRDHKGSERAFRYCRLGLLYHGLLHFDELQTYTHNQLLYDEIVDHKLALITPHRLKLIQCLVSTAGKQKPIKMIQEILNSADERHRVVYNYLNSPSRCTMM
ncbi:unnamed protein product [Adineta ricciae]|uniref:AIG1-type G domain-containing protein n=1 Tax=Adineta ricciae TaxID=249248 RepID=A0A814X4N4_ADIRI|nr:unnamed protein product [Adineta ricciae]CAF1458249.1 unnamed protein product [Adineta ricciae]